MCDGSLTRHTVGMLGRMPAAGQMPLNEILQGGVLVDSALGGAAWFESLATTAVAHYFEGRAQRIELGVRWYKARVAPDGEVGEGRAHLSSSVCFKPFSVCVQCSCSNAHSHVRTVDHHGQQERFITRRQRRKNTLRTGRPAARFDSACTLFTLVPKYS
jgi:hypothetical protein